MTAIINFLFAAIKAGTPLLFGTTGEIVTQKAGNLNLGVEGMMYMGAFTGFYVGLTTGSLPLALLAAFGAGMLGALIYAFLTVTLKANQNVTGLTLTIFGTGFANFFGEVMISQTAGGQKTCWASWPSIPFPCSAASPSSASCSSPTTCWSIWRWWWPCCAASTSPAPGRG